MEYRALMKDPKYQNVYAQLYANELRRLAQGIRGRVMVANSIFFIGKDNVPQDRCRDVTYGQVVVDCQPKKGDLY